MESYITDISLAPGGHDKINWVKMYMPLLRDIEQEFIDTKPFEGINIALSIHLEAKTAYLCKVLAAGGANMGISGSNPLSTQDDVAAALAEDGLFVAAHHGATQQQYMEDLNHILDIKPDII
ncbi:MAG: adenosylhomocysteinase, partial [Clostridiales bacterium]|nr:adenosylhomocysteinase [Clostridiales bacterium]